MLMQTPGNKSVSQLLSTYVYERGVLNSDFGYATAVSFFNSLVSLLLIGTSNFVSKKLAGEAFASPADGLNLLFQEKANIFSSRVLLAV